VSKEESLGSSLDELVKGSPHFFFVQAIFSRQESEAVGLKINQCVADDQRPAIRRMIKGDFAGDGSFDLDYLQFTADRSAVFCLSESRRFQAGKGLSGCPDWG
jgi:hypothetical protein